MMTVEIDHAERQLPANFAGAVKFLKRPDLAVLPDGRVEMEGGGSFALVQRYSAEPAAAPRFEYHRKYIDVQYIVSGEEIIGWAPAGRMKVADAYDPDKDCCFGSVKEGEWTPVFMRAGQLAVFWPEDAHAPKMAAGVPSPVMKIVVKIAV